MARPKLTKEAIAFIIECRDDPTSISTWKDIAKMVDDKFGIKVSFQAIAKNYKRHKDKIDISNIKPKQTTKTKTVFKEKQSTALDPIFTKDDDIDLKDLFDKAE